MLALKMDTDSTTNAVKEEPLEETDNSCGLKITNVVSLARDIISDFMHSTVFMTWLRVTFQNLSSMV